MLNYQRVPIFFLRPKESAQLYDAKEISYQGGWVMTSGLSPHFGKPQIPS
jgi:hypothetical protein